MSGHSIIHGEECECDVSVNVSVNVNVKVSVNENVKNVSVRVSLNDIVSLSPHRIYSYIVLTCIDSVSSTPPAPAPTTARVMEPWKEEGGRGKKEDG